MTCASPSVATPSTRVRVVCGLGVTIASLWPTSRLSSVDLPAFGAPISATWPHRVGVARSSANASDCVPFRPVDDLREGGKPHSVARFRVADDLLQDPDPRSVTDDMRMHRQLENAAIVIRGIKFALENIEHVGRRGI